MEEDRRRRRIGTDLHHLMHRMISMMSISISRIVPITAPAIIPAFLASSSSED